MRTTLSRWLTRVAHWLTPKAGRAAPPGGWAEGPSFIDAYRRVRAPTPQDLLAELKHTAYACASLNAAVCAAHPPRLYVMSRPDDPVARCLTRSLSRPEHDRLVHHPRFAARVKAAARVEEVLDHPLLTLLRQVNPGHNSHDIWELTTLDQEVHGSAYWLLERHPTLGVPEAIWPLPAHRVTPRREPGSPRLVDWYEYRSADATRRYRPDEVIHFRYPDPRDPYGPGLSPLRAVYESASLSGQFLAYKRSLWDNSALPGVIISPDEAISPQERERLEAQWNARFRRGGNGRVLVAENGLSVDVVSHSPGDVAALAEAGATKEDIANAFGVPLAFLTSETNLANLQAAEHQHLSQSIRPRLARRDEKLNEALLPLYDPSGRLFVASDDPTPANQDFELRRQEADLKWGVRTVNEVRAERGLPAVEWGDRPWRPTASEAGDRRPVDSRTAGELPDD